MNTIASRGHDVMITTRAGQGEVGGSFPSPPAASPEGITHYYVFGSRNNNDMYGRGFYIKTSDRSVAETIHQTFLEHFQETGDVGESFMRLETVDAWEDLLVWGG